MTTRMTPKLPEHSGQSPGGKVAPYLSPGHEAADQLPPEPDRLIRQRKSLNDQPAHPESLESFR